MLKTGFIPVDQTVESGKIQEVLDDVYYWCLGMVSGGLPSAAIYKQGRPMLVLSRKQREQIVMKRKRVCACEGHTLDRLLQPTVMAMLAEEPLHGYALIEKLKASPLMKGDAPDPTGVYRLLKTLEEQGLVSHGSSPSKEGPEKRPYKLTPSGKKCVGKWINALNTYQKDISRLVAMMRKTNTAYATSRQSRRVGAGQKQH